MTRNLSNAKMKTPGGKNSPPGVALRGFRDLSANFGKQVRVIRRLLPPLEFDFRFFIAEGNRVSRLVDRHFLAAPGNTKRKGVHGDLPPFFVDSFGVFFPL